MIYETDDEIRYRINQNVRYFLSASSSFSAGVAGFSTNSGGKREINDVTSVGCADEDDEVTSVTTASVYTSSSATFIPNPEQAKRSIDTYFRLIHVVIFARCQTSRDCEFASSISTVEEAVRIMKKGRERNN